MAALLKLHGPISLMVRFHVRNPGFDSEAANDRSMVEAGLQVLTNLSQQVVDLRKSELTSVHHGCITLDEVELIDDGLEHHDILVSFTHGIVHSLIFANVNLL